MAGQEKTLCLLYCYKGENKENNMSIHSETRKYEVVVVGGYGVHQRHRLSRPEKGLQ